MQKYILLVLFILVPFLAQAHRVPTDLPLLRDVICGYETEGEPDPDNPRRYPWTLDEEGRCQIRLSTARDMGFTGSTEYLKRRYVNDYWALRYIRHCARTLRRDEPERLAHAYVGGPYLQWEGRGEARRYAAVIKVRYEKAVITKFVAMRKQIGDML